MSILYVTENFSWQEFACNSGEDVPEDVKPAVRRLCTTVLEPIRKRWNAPINVQSGWRSRAWNARVGGAKLSKHVTGEAADIRPVSPLKVDQLRALIEDMIREGDLPELGGVGYYPGRWVHVDVRAKPLDGHIARWTGKGIGSEDTA